MSKRWEIRLTGSGGQGLILGAIILAEAAVIEEKYAVQSQSYGPEARGGSSKADIIISDDEIDFPKANKLDVLLALTQEALNKNMGESSEKTIVIFDSSLSLPEGIVCKKAVKAPILKTAKEVVGKSIVANIVAIAALNGIIGLVKEESLEEALMHKVPKGTEELNKRSLTEGYRLAEASQAQENR